MITEANVLDLFREHILNIPPVASKVGNIYDELPTDADNAPVVSRIVVSDLQGSYQQLASVFLLTRVADIPVGGRLLRDKRTIADIEDAIVNALSSGCGNSWRFDLESQSCIPSPDAISHTISTRFTFYYNNE